MGLVQLDNLLLQTTKITLSPPPTTNQLGFFNLVQSRFYMYFGICNQLKNCFHVFGD